MGSFAAPQLIFGCGGLGNEFVGADSVKELLGVLKELGVSHLDTAGLYPPTDIGASQRLIGETGAAGLGFAIDTKVMISMKGFAGTLEPAKIETSIENSISDLRLEGGQRIGTYYAHAPDVATPLQDQAKGFDAQYRKGRFDKLGLCNYPTETLAEYIEICEREGYVKPSVFQGCYNIIDRRHEGATMDLIRKHNITFVAHSPNASGFLHGKLTSGQVEGTRFAPGNIMSTDARRYDTEKHHEVIRFLDSTLEPHGISKTDASLRWLAFHSQLTPNDYIIFGASKLPQVKQNVTAVAQGPLPDDVVQAIDSVWKTLKA